MRVTVIADASFCPQHRVAGYGYWIASERGKRAGGGPMRNKVHSATVAEMMAIVNALHDGVKHMLIQIGDEVLVQSDCMGAIEILQRTCTLNQHVEHVASKYHELVKRACITVTFRHVKGHTNHVEPRFAANRACDQRAKNAMRERRRVEQG